MARSVGEDHLQLGVFDPVHLDPGGPLDPHQPRLQLITVSLWQDPPLHPLRELTVLPVFICQYRLTFHAFSWSFISLFSDLDAGETRVWFRGAITAASSAGDHCSRVITNDSVAAACSLNNHSIFVFKFLLQQPQIFFQIQTSDSNIFLMLTLFYRMNVLSQYYSCPHYSVIDERVVIWHSLLLCLPMPYMSVNYLWYFISIEKITLKICVVNCMTNFRQMCLTEIFNVTVSFSL